jgi:hypothetical protein
MNHIERVRTRSAKILISRTVDWTMGSVQQFLRTLDRTLRSVQGSSGPNLDTTMYDAIDLQNLNEEWRSHDELSYAAQAFSAFCLPNPSEGTS